LDKSRVDATFISVEPVPTIDEAGLLAEAERRAAGEGFVCYTFPTPELDPLAVLETLNEPAPRGYFENPSRRRAHAAGSPVRQWTGRGDERFQHADRWLRETDASLTCVGPRPRIIATFPFYPGDAAAGAEARLFLPGWQVVTEDGQTTVTLCEAASPGCAARLAIRAESFRKFTYRSNPAPPRAPVPTVLSEVGGAWFPSAVVRATELIKEGSFEKIVLSRAFDWRRAEPFSIYATLHRLRRGNPQCHSFLVDEAEGALVGATPETLLSLFDGAVRSESVAGTTRRGESASEDASLAEALLTSDKDRREHTAVTASILRRLRMVGVLAATSRNAELLRLGNVMHLRTPIEGVMPMDRRFLEVAGELHPTPAVGGKPRALALPFIPGFEPHQRGLYTGAVGWIRSDGSSGKLFVALRCARLKGSEARAFAGAGIVAGSNPDAESTETEMKLRTILEALI
jgi:menaquinone-specific isochorismate synthase